MADVLEILMLVCFGASWPLNILKSWRARTAKGKSILFNILIFGGYVFGAASKFVMLANGNAVKIQVIVVYLFNAVMVLADCALFVRNKRLDASDARE